MVWFTRRELLSSATRAALATPALSLSTGLLGQLSRKAPPLSEKANAGLFSVAARAWAEGDYKQVRASCEAVLAAPAEPHIHSYAWLRIAQSYLAEKNGAAAQKAYEEIRSNSAYPEVHRYEAEECLQEIVRRAQGLPARDATSSRTKIPTVINFAIEFFVAPEGTDANPGTRRLPFATFVRARDAIRALKASGPLPGPVCVNLMPGIYPVEKTIELTEADSGTAEAPVVYRAFKHGYAIFYGGMQLKAFAPVTDTAILERVPAEAHGKIFQCDLKAAGAGDYGPLVERGYGIDPPAATFEVFFNQAALTPARWPKSGFVNGGKIIAPGSKRDNIPSIFEYLDDRPSRWTKAEDAWLFGYFRYGWADRTLKIRSIDTAARQIAVSPYDYGGENMQPYEWFNRGRIKYYAFNLLEELSQQGEMYIDRSQGILYFYPPANPAGAAVEVSMLSTHMLTLNRVSNVRLEGLVFDLSRAGCMLLENCEDCLVAGCTVKRFAGTGISIHGGHGNGLLACDLYNLGRGATEVFGGERETLTPARHFIENCLMHTFGRLDHTYVPGIQMVGVGIRAAHNRICNCPTSAIRFDGNDLIMEYNQLERTVEESEDQGAIETFANPTYRGNVIRYNFISFVGYGAEMEGRAGRAGVRLDDIISGTLIYSNIFFHASQGFGGVQINGGRDNVIDNNVFAACEKGITGAYYAGAEGWGLIGKKPEFIMSPLYLRRYPGLSELFKTPGLNNAWRNVFWRCGPLFTSNDQPASDQFRLLENAEYPNGDPGFVAAAEGDFRMKPNADVLSRIAFRPIPVQEIGLYENEYRFSL